MPYGYAKHTGTTDTPFQWLGGYGVYYDADTQLHLTLYRAYSCHLKRFMQADPLGIDGGSNVYMMANLNPLWFIDPYGLCPEDPWYKKTMQVVVNVVTYPDYGDVWKGIKGINRGVLVMVGGALLTQGDSPAPGPLDAAGAGLVFKGFGDASMSFSLVVQGLAGGSKVSPIDDTMIKTVGNAMSENNSTVNTVVGTVEGLIPTPLPDNAPQQLKDLKSTLDTIDQLEDVFGYEY